MKKFIYLTEKIHLIIYQITLGFAAFFYLLMKGATGHKFIITNEEIIYFIILFSAFVVSGFYKETKRFSKNFNIVVLYLFLVFTLLTFAISLYFLYFSFNFDYEYSIMVFFLFYLVPIIFSWCNFYLIKKIIKKINLKSFT